MREMSAVGRQRRKMKEHHSGGRTGRQQALGLVAFLIICLGVSALGGC